VFAENCPFGTSQHIVAGSARLLAESRAGLGEIGERARNNIVAKTSIPNALGMSCDVDFCAHDHVIADPADRLADSFPTCENVQFAAKDVVVSDSSIMNASCPTGNVVLNAASLISKSLAAAARKCRAIHSEPQSIG
jgi:hypothetical protein